MNKILFPENVIMSCRSQNLSSVTKASWLPGGSLVLSRKKFEPNGKPKQWEYKIYVKAEVCFAILDKHPTTQVSMQELLDEKLSNPHVIELTGQHVLRLSLLPNYHNKNEQVQYYGIHVLDEGGDILPGLGLNLKTDEYKNLIDMLTIHNQNIGDYRIQSYYKGQLQINVYGWNWHHEDVVCQPWSDSRGNWFINPASCYKEAMEFKPSDDKYKLKVF